MTIQELYNEAKVEEFKSLIYLIEWLVFEKKVVSLESNANNIEYIIEKYKGQLNPYLIDYKTKVEGAASGLQFSEPKIDDLSVQ
ncbi:hypothetical protein CR203_17390 [Salipaludibacillus neizhouensis]|uniref:Uncharacterized protein n=1 Tax=Salipaludibacillus neizhouensis TaxID=885475 RepID=A0A3A9KMV7_9BACI|nr:hypothetical protein [Salipaludibacillus neizhouensis]RKL66066.1 hypothetical protein CR203_17390 [Salipaludibacillus neizhouensis]